ncbi:hypothetical protein PIB30_025153 [Stylosanthes scabra]|uniref:Zinc knuckle CX2CX4HX4C domain-containing protein n=1 Tax=Stylosanthes scabra TaxID=79078 RepID=A0ABU6XBS8_9FABA|nr:hypothetical protein [Stylosanthes scabra]
MDGALKAIWSNAEVWVQIWGLIEKFKTLDTGHKMGGKLGRVTDVSLFEVRGRESRILKVKIELSGHSQLMDSMKIAGPDKKTLEAGLRYERLGIVCTYCAKLGHDIKNCPTWIENSAANQIHENYIGDWVKANQVGRRVEIKEGVFPTTSSPGDSSVPKPKKKHSPSWLLESFSKLNVHNEGRKSTNFGVAITTPNSESLKEG